MVKAPTKEVVLPSHISGNALARLDERGFAEISEVGSWKAEDDDTALNMPPIVDVKVPVNMMPMTTIEGDVVGTVLKVAQLAYGVVWGQIRDPLTGFVLAENVYQGADGRPKIEALTLLAHLFVLREDGRLSATCLETIDEKGKKYFKKSLKALERSLQQGNIYRFSTSGKGKTLTVRADPVAATDPKAVRMKAMRKRFDEEIRLERLKTGPGAEPLPLHVSPTLEQRELIEGVYKDAVEKEAAPAFFDDDEVGEK